MAMRTQADYTIGAFQVWVHDRRRRAETEEERSGWIRLDTWVNRQVVFLKSRYPHQSVNGLPMFALVEEGINEN